MRKLFFTTLLVIAVNLIFPIVAQSAGDNGKADIAFSEGLLFYQQKKYSVAEGRFSQALRLNPSHQASAHFFGMSLYQQEKYAAAVFAFNEAIKIDPDQPESYFYKGISLRRLGREGESTADFEKVVALSREGSLGELARSYLRSGEKEKEVAGEGGKAGEEGKKGAKEKPWFVSGSLTTQFDTNVSLSPENVTVASLPADQNDVQIAAQVGGGYHFYEKGGYRVTGKASYYQSVYTEFQSYDYGLARGELSQQFRAGNLLVRVPVSYGFSHLGHSKYLSSIEVGPSVGYFIAKRFLTTIKPQMQFNGFFQTLTNAAQDRDAKNLQAELAQYVFSADRKRYVKVSYELEQNWAAGADWDYRGHVVGASFLSPIGLGLDLDVHTAITINKQFAHVDSVLGIRRKDMAQAVGLSLSREIIKHLVVSGHYDFFRNDSNISFFSYNRHLMGMTLETSF